ncbi:hypothetical protein N5853_05080 [Bartonella sp. HY329]|uniref:hypothetical protein n=1 Tax=unclassified Bartonella TaxID=2645622 RepID=UPI0021C5DB0B|nr:MULTISPECIES: hypothetical protein [unclassified Bartonella]UXM95997.1 hypothetical protein N5853_05080 [Bartonella sp. HY329]UXN10322.1 hypothetical protein N5852_05090 [Bartonella sp. HY328]
MKSIKAIIMVAFGLGLVLVATNAKAQSAANHSSGVSPITHSTVAHSTNELPAAEDASQLKQLQYLADCKKNKIDCKIAYDVKEGEKQNKQAQSKSDKENRVQSNPRPKPVFGGSTAMIVVLLLVIGAILLWLRFGGSGVLLSPALKEIKAPSEVPENWAKTNTAISQASKDILSAVLAMDDKRIAMIELLRMCLLHAATISSTRLARSDTERTVFRRLPEILPQRDDLALLLETTELVHYGGQEITSDQFDCLIDKARNFLSIRKMANA